MGFPCLISSPEIFYLLVPAFAAHVDPVRIRRVQVEMTGTTGNEPLFLEIGLTDKYGQTPNDDKQFPHIPVGSRVAFYLTAF